MIVTPRQADAFGFVESSSMTSNKKNIATMIGIKNSSHQKILFNVGCIQEIKMNAYSKSCKFCVGSIETLLVNKIFYLIC